MASDSTIQTCITNTGLSIIAQSQLGATITFTKVKIGDGYLNETDPKELEELVSPLQELDIYNKEFLDNETVSVSAYVAPAETGYYFREIGLFAINPATGQEVLYAYGNKGDAASYIAPNTTNVIIEDEAQIITKVANTDNVVIIIDNSGHGGGVWGSITGNIQDQTDLQTLLAGLLKAKSDTDFSNITDAAKEVIRQNVNEGIPTSNCMHLRIEHNDDGSVSLQWKDPSDTIIDDQVLSTWKKTVIVRKKGEFPQDITDGDVIIENTRRELYDTQILKDTPPTDGDYYYRAFPVSVNGVVNLDPANEFDAAIEYEFLFDSTNANVKGSITYPVGSINEHYKAAGMDYENNRFDYGSWGNSFLMDLFKPVMLYNKYGNNIGVSVKGALNDNEGDYSGFTTAIYANIDYIPETVEEIESFDLAAGFTTGETINTTQQTIYGNSTTNAHSPQLVINTSKKLEWSIPTSAFAYTNGTIASSGDIEPSTHYKTRIVYNKTEATLTAYMATNTGSEVQMGQLSVSSIGWDEIIRLGLDLLAGPFNGTIHIKECYFDINGEKVFDGSKYQNLNGQIMEELNPNDYSVTVDGKPSHVSDTSCNANAMRQWKPFYIKAEEYEPNKFHFYISNKKKSEDYKCWTHYGTDNSITEFYYDGLFDGCNVDNIIRCLAGQAICKNVAGNTQIAYAKQNGKGWNSNELRAILAEQILLLLIGKSTDTQTVFGTGRYSGGSANANNQLNTGMLINRGPFSGDKDNGAVKTFHRENPWGNIWKITQGLISVNGKLYIKLTPNTADGSTATDYTDGTNADGYIDTGITLSNVTAGYIDGVSLVGGMGLLPDKTSGSSSTFIPDAVWVASGTMFARFGGSSVYGLCAGVFALFLDNPVSSPVWDYGVSLSYTPS